MNIKEELDIIKRNIIDIFPGEKELEEKIILAKKEKRPLKIKYGVDPTAPDIHLGHTVVLRKLREFQDLGHIVQFLIGDFTARIGDPSGRNELRKPLGEDVIQENSITYQKQVFKILDKTKTELIYNSKWFGKMSFADFLKISSHYTVARVLERAEFKERFRKNQEISLLEFMYPLLQGYDSVMLENDIEIGGTDQTFNLLVGRDLQKTYGQKEQIVLTMPLLEGTDGVRKMSKSYGNYIGITDTPSQIYGKTMSIPDSLIFRYMELLTFIEHGKILELKKDVESSGLNPRDAKAILACELVKLYYGEDESKRAKEEFVKVFSGNDIPDEMPVIEIEKEKIWLVEALVLSKYAKNKTDANRLITQGSVEIDSKTIKDPNTDIILDKEHIIKVGKYRFVKIKAK